MEYHKLLTMLLLFQLQSSVYGMSRVHARSIRMHYCKNADHVGVPSFCLKRAMECDAKDSSGTGLFQTLKSIRLYRLYNALKRYQQRSN